MPRLPYKQRNDLPVDKQHIYDRIAQTRGSVPQVFQALLNSPGAASAVTSLGEYIRYKSNLDPVVRETAILTVAREMNSEYEWAQHEAIARQAGVRDQVIESIRIGKAPMGLPAKEGVFAQIAKELVRNGTASPLTFQAVDHLIGPEQTVDLIVLVGYYMMIGRIIASLGVEMDAGLTANLPPIEKRPAMGFKTGAS